ncbi:MAG TPA: CehA/McbA family metallohydrolase [Thermoplasmata archaeon]|nr:CehA/McbA family metallohydrolase [Thermoplasmata archaeon]
MSDGLRLDLHVHSTWSPDSRLDLESIVGRLSYMGLRGFALTDHNTVAGHRALAALRARHPEYLFVPGVEVSTVEGHLLAYGLSEAPPPHRPITETIEWIDGRGGVAVVAHPFRWTHGVGRRVATGAAVPALETRNGHNSELANAKADLLAAQRGLGSTGGSDAHELRDLGRTFTEWPDRIESVDDLLEGLRHGRTAAAGPSLPIGGRVRLSARNALLFVGRGFRSV